MTGSVIGTPRLLLRLEGLATFIVAVAVYRQFGQSWWLFALLFLAPDLAMLGYLAGPRVGSVAYNIAHFYLLPLLLAAIGLSVAQPVVAAVAVIWIAHIGIDRALGYGLKYPEGFAATHLGALGGRRTA